MSCLYHIFYYSTITIKQVVRELSTGSSDRPALIHINSPLSQDLMSHLQVRLEDDEIRKAPRPRASELRRKFLLSDNILLVSEFYNVLDVLCTGVIIIFFQRFYVLYQ